jgi:hypothetical protein
LWSEDDLNAVIEAKNKKDQLLIDLFHYQTWILSTYILNQPIDVEVLDPVKMIAHIRNVRANKVETTEPEIDPEILKRQKAAEDLYMYQRHQKKVAQRNRKTNNQ